MDGSLKGVKHLKHEDGGFRVEGVGVVLDVCGRKRAKNEVSEERSVFSGIGESLNSWSRALRTDQPTI